MKIAIWTTVAAVGLALTGCGSNNNASSTSTSGSGTGGSAPASTEAPSDFAVFVAQQVATEPAFGSAPAVTTGLTSDLQLGNASYFSSSLFGPGDPLPAGTYQASVACAQAGAACNPTVSADLNSTLN